MFCCTIQNSKPYNLLRMLSWIEIDGKRLCANIDAFKNLLTPITTLMVVVKANAYGHGLQAVTPLIAERADWLGSLAVASAGSRLKRDTICCQRLSATLSLRCRARGKPSIWDKTVSKRSGNVRLKNRQAGVVPSAARPSKLCTTVHTLYLCFGNPR